MLKNDAAKIQNNFMQGTPFPPSPITSSFCLTQLQIRLNIGSALSLSKQTISWHESLRDRQGRGGETRGRLWCHRHKSYISLSNCVACTHADEDADGALLNGAYGKLKLLCSACADCAADAGFGSKFASSLTAHIRSKLKFH